MKLITVSVDDDIWRQANCIFEDTGIDFSTATKMFLKKVIKERSIAFLFNTQSVENVQIADAMQPKHEVYPRGATQSSQSSIDNNLTKSMAKRLIYSKHLLLYPFVTFASKNRSAYNYWANPEFTLLDNNWSLILNDWVNRTIYLFNIPAKSIAKSELVARQDKPGLIDLQIMYEDPTFTDNRSGYSFLKYQTAEINY